MKAIVSGDDERDAARGVGRPARIAVSIVLLRVAVPVAAALGAGFLVAQTIAIATATHRTLPLMDEWADLRVFRSFVDGRGLLDVLFAQHNEHRIAVPRLVIFADYAWLAGAGWLSLAAIWVLQAAHAALLGGLPLLARPRDWGAFALAAVPFALLFSLRQGETLTWGFCIAVAGVFALASLGIALFAAAASPGRSRRSACACAAVAFGLATASGLSMTNGLIAAPVLVVLALLARRRWLALAATVFALGLIAAFSIGYSVGPDHEGFAGWVRHPARLITYTAAYLGNFLDTDFDSAGLLGGAGLLATLAIAARCAVREERSPARLALLGIVLFAAGSAALTALGRSYQGLEGAMASRYATGSATFWSALLGLGWSLAGAGRRPVATRVLVGAAALVLVVAAARAQAPARAYLRDLAGKQALLEDGLLVGLVDGSALDALQDSPDIEAEVAFLATRRMAVFAEPDGALYGRPLAGMTEASPCPGSLDAAPAPDLDARAIRLSGTLAGTRAGNIRRILVVDGAGTVVGFGSTRFGSDAWAGYAKASPGTVLEAFARVPDGGLCRVARRTAGELDGVGTASSPRP